MLVRAAEVLSVTSISRDHLRADLITAAERCPDFAHESIQEHEDEGSNIRRGGRTKHLPRRRRCGVSGSLVRAVYSAWNSSLWRWALRLLRAEAGAAKAVRGHMEGGPRGRGACVFVVRSCWSWLRDLLRDHHPDPPLAVTFVLDVLRRSCCACCCPVPRRSRGRAQAHAHANAPHAHTPKHARKHTPWTRQLLRVWMPRSPALNGPPQIVFISKGENTGPHSHV